MGLRVDGGILRSMLASTLKVITQSHSAPSVLLAALQPERLLLLEGQDEIDTSFSSDCQQWQARNQCSCCHMIHGILI